MLDTKQSPKYEHSVPCFWPLALIAEMGKEGLAVYKRNLDFASEVMNEEVILAPAWASKNDILYEGDVMRLRDFSDPKVRTDKTVVPTLVDARPMPGIPRPSPTTPRGKSGRDLMAGGLRRVRTDWKSATIETRDLEIDNYLADMVVAIDDLGGRVNLVGLCQGGWVTAMIAARFPEKVNTLVLAGAPIDTDAGKGPIKRLAHKLPLSFYEELVELGGGLMRGKFMLAGWKAMHPEVHYLKNFVDLYENVEDPAFLKKRDEFARWYEHPLDLPGRWYLQAIKQIFKDNEFCKGEFKALGRKIGLHDITCPAYLLAGEGDDITPYQQVFEADKRLGTAKDKIVKKLVPGGHIGLFMGKKTLAEAWPEVAKWIKQVSPNS